MDAVHAMGEEFQVLTVLQPHGVSVPCCRALEGVSDQDHQVQGESLPRGVAETVGLPSETQKVRSRASDRHYDTSKVDKWREHCKAVAVSNVLCCQLLVHQKFEKIVENVRPLKIGLERKWVGAPKTAGGAG
eukprot:2854632-Amphidinium_carterae.1